MSDSPNTPNASNASNTSNTPHAPTTTHTADSSERVFPALAPATGRGFARSWWGLAWLKALEDTALDGAQLKKGRKRAREGAVGAVSVRPGRITAVVRDPDGTAHRSDVLLRELTGDEWDRFLDMAADRAGHVAALLDREMPPHLVEDAASAGVELLPGIGDLEPECGCEAWDHCPHSAALCYQVARLLDEDPYVLLLMRGRSERRLLDELQVRSAVRAAQPGAGDSDVEDGNNGADEGELAGVLASEAFAAAEILPPLPAPPVPPQAMGQPPAFDTETAPPGEIDADALRLLAADAAARALRLLTEALSPGHEQQPLEDELTPGQDGARLAAGAEGGSLAARRATGTGRRPVDLDLAVRAWRHGGAAALAVLEEDLTPDPEALARAKAALDTAWDGGDRPRTRAVAPGRWSVVGTPVQLRCGADGRWWPYRQEQGRWAPVGPAHHDPAAALADGLGEW
jgi:uncharacterized Zn finger protein